MEVLVGATLYPSAAQDDHRPPRLALRRRHLIVQGRIHELTELHPGQRP